MNCDEDIFILGPSTLQCGETPPTKEINLDLNSRQKIVIRPLKISTNYLSPITPGTSPKSLESIFHGLRKEKHLIAKSKSTDSKKSTAKPKLVTLHKSPTPSKKSAPSMKLRAEKLEKVKEAREVSEKRGQQVLAAERRPDTAVDLDSDDEFVLDPLSAKQWDHCKCTVGGRERCRPCKLAKAFDRFYRRVDLLQYLIEEPRDPHWRSSS